MRFQIFSETSIEEHERTGSPLRSPHPDATFDQELQGWVIDIPTLESLVEMTVKAGPVSVAKFPQDLPVIAILDAADA